MALNLKNPEVERLAAEVARLTGESKTEAIRRALLERRLRLKGKPTAQRRARLLEFLETKVWPSVPAGQLGRRLTRAEEDGILGDGPGGEAPRWTRQRSRRFCFRSPASSTWSTASCWPTPCAWVLPPW